LRFQTVRSGLGGFRVHDSIRQLQAPASRLSGGTAVHPTRAGSSQARQRLPDLTTSTPARVTGIPLPCRRHVTGRLAIWDWEVGARGGMASASGARFVTVQRQRSSEPGQCGGVTSERASTVFPAPRREGLIRHFTLPQHCEPHMGWWELGWGHWPRLQTAA
jgi:hypothetical protein